MRQSSKKLYLIRHGRAQNDGHILMDFNRPLSALGISHTIALAEELKEHHIPPPQCVFCSTSLRTRQTCEVLGPWLGKADIFFQDSLYLAPITRIQHVLEQTDNIFHTVMIIGHNNGIANFVAATSPKKNIVFDTSCCAILKLPAGATWQNITPGQMHLDLFLNPQKISA